MPEGSPVYTVNGREYSVGNAPYGAPRRPAPRSKGQEYNGKTAGHRPVGPNGQPPRRPQPKKEPPKKKKTFNKDKFFLHVKTFFVRLAVMLLAVSLLGAWWYRAEFYSKGSERRGDVVFVVSGDAERAYKTKAKTAYREDILYVDFTLLAKWFDMVSVGSVNSMRFICTEGKSDTSAGTGGEEYAIFVNGSATVYINGISVMLEAPCKAVDSHIWVPLSFVENYMSGVVCDRGARGVNITFAPSLLENEEGETEESTSDDEEIVFDVSFKVKAQNTPAHVQYPE